ncbi:MAG: hypothetical protein MR550_00910 [Bacilli bacterium]|nr:hypothetical protein [Bacilli bacterium]
MNNVNSYIILNKSTNKLIKLFIITSLFIILLLVLTLNIKYKKYYYLYGQVDNNYRLILYCDIKYLEVLKKNNKVVINNNTYNYKILSIDTNYTVLNNTNNYIQVVIDINLNSEDKITNNILKLKVLVSNKKLFYYLIDYIKKG